MQEKFGSNGTGGYSSKNEGIKNISLFSSHSYAVKFNTHLVPSGISWCVTVKTLGSAKTRLDHTLLKVLPYLNKRRNLCVHQRGGISSGHLDKEGQSDQVSTGAEFVGLLWIPFPLMMATMSLSGTV